MKLSIFLNLTFYYDGENYTTDERYFMFWKSFTDYFEKVVFCVPVLETKEKRGKFFLEHQNGKIEICRLPFYKNPFELYSRFPSICLTVKRIIRSKISSWDIIGAVVPNIIGLTILGEADRTNTPSFAYIRGYHRRTVKFEFRGIKRISAYLVASILEYITKQKTRHRLTFVVGKELFDKYATVSRFAVKIVVSLISQSDIVQRAPFIKKSGSIIKIMHLGRLSAERGVGDLIKAISILNVQSNKKYELTIVGDGSDRDFLYQKTILLKLEKQVTFLGHLPYGEKIKKLFSEADMFVLPSLTEGFPKVILEALANGIPIIATRVGGIPDVIKHGVNGILVRPSDPVALSAAIQNLGTDADLRKQFAENGLRTVEQYTLETQRENIMIELDKYCKSRQVSLREA